MFTRMRMFAEFVPTHSAALCYAADELERVNEWVKPAMPEPTAEQIVSLEKAFLDANRAMSEAFDAYKRAAMTEIPFPC